MGCGLDVFLVSFPPPPKLVRLGIAGLFRLSRTTHARHGACGDNQSYITDRSIAAVPRAPDTQSGRWGGGKARKAKNHGANWPAWGQHLANSRPRRRRTSSRHAIPRIMRHSPPTMRGTAKPPERMSGGCVGRRAVAFVVSDAGPVGAAPTAAHPRIPTIPQVRTAYRSIETKTTGTPPGGGQGFCFCSGTRVTSSGGLSLCGQKLRVSRAPGHVF